MKTLLVGINSKYIHLNLAIRYLKEFCPEKNIILKEYTINNNLDSVVSDIFAVGADIVGFSCYIWNIEYILKMITTLKKANPKVKILLGGPEVSYDPKEFLQEYPEIDYIIFGEGEETFKEFIEAFENRGDLCSVDGLAFREGNDIKTNNERKLIGNLDIINFPYRKELDTIKDRMVYYEASRGCPFNCQYCLSSTIHGVRNLSLEKVKDDLKKLVEAEVSQVKFVDRTFNCSKLRTVEIFKYLMELNPKVNFHFEITAELLDDEIIELLKQAPKGLFQFEIGVQSTNENTLEIISRKSSFEDLSDIVNKLNSCGNIHLHLDLIAGLPDEDYESFSKSFNNVYNLKPQMLQLGFLKLLRGSGLRKRAQEWDTKYRNYAPYEVISTKDISFEELSRLKVLEDILDRYYNSGRFENTIKYIISTLFQNTPFSFYEQFSNFWRDNKLFEIQHSEKSLYTILFNYFRGKEINPNILNNLIRFDYLLNHEVNSLPEGIDRGENLIDSSSVFEFLKNTENIKKFLPHYEGVPSKQIIKKINVEAFDYDVMSYNHGQTLREAKTVVLFDYSNKNRLNLGPNIANISSKFLQYI